MTIYEWAKDIAEFIYFLASIGLAIGLVFTYKQLKLMKKDAEDRNKRAAIEKSIEYLNWFATDFIPKTGKAYQLLDGKQINVYRNLKKYTFNYDDIVRREKQVVDSVRHKTEAGFANIANELEYFSAAMVSGLADEELAFNPLSKVFCQFVENTYDFYCESREGEQGKNLYTHTIRLYNTWGGRLKEVEIAEKQKQLDQEKSQIKTEEIKPIGS